MAPTRARGWSAAGSGLAALAGVLLALLAAAASGLAADNVPTITNLHAKPKRFCAKRSDTCSHPGTTIHFTLDRAARVRGVIRPGFEPTGNVLEFAKHFPAGPNRVRLDDPHLRPGTWILRLQATNRVGSGGVVVTHVRVVKHD